MMKLGTFHGAALLLAGTFAAAAAFAQTASTPRPGARPAPSRSAPAAATPPAQAPAAGPAAPAPTGGNLQLPSNPVFLGDTDTTVRKATAIVNGSVITATDVDQRLALIVLANGGGVPPDEKERLGAQGVRTPRRDAAAARAGAAHPRRRDARDPGRGSRRHQGRAARDRFLLRPLRP